MKTEEPTQPEIDLGELHFDAHEFDGLRDELVSAAETWVAQANRFVRSNPWVCVTAAVAAGCALSYFLCRPDADRGEEQGSD